MDFQDSKILEDPSNMFSKFGLSPNQSKVYLHLIMMGPKTASQISKTLNIPRTETYHLIKILKEKGCVYASAVKPMKFLPIPINDFLEKTIASEEKKIQKLKTVLETVKNSSLENSVKLFSTQTF